MSRLEISVICNNGTHFKIEYDRMGMEYVLYGRLSSSKGSKWAVYERQYNYADVLDFLFDEIRGIDAKRGV